jgi:uncharacterized membrane protein YeaQ/YmgE (transglycosylase-associated protein family)
MNGCIVHLILALIVGWISQRLLGYREIDFLTTLILGLVGSYIGTGIARHFNLPYAFPKDTVQVWGHTSIPYAVAGCVLFIFVVNLILRRARTDDKLD